MPSNLNIFEPFKHTSDFVGYKADRGDPMLIFISTCIFHLSLFTYKTGKKRPLCLRYSRTR